MWIVCQRIVQKAVDLQKKKIETSLIFWKKKEKFQRYLPSKFSEKSPSLRKKPKKGKENKTLARTFLRERSFWK